MEHTEFRDIRPVHVLQHRLDANDQLAQELDTLLVPSARGKQLSIFATRLAILDGHNYHLHRYHKSVEAVRTSFNAKTAAIHLNGKVNFLERDNGVVRIRFQPLEQDRFNTLLEGFDGLDTLGEDMSEKDHYLYAEATTDMVIPEEVRKDAFAMFRRRVSTPQLRRLNYVTPLEITGRDSLHDYTPEDAIIAARGITREPWETAS